VNRAKECGDRVNIWCPACDEPHGPKVKPLKDPGSWTWNGSLQNPTFSPSLLVRWSGVVDGKEVLRVCHSYVEEGRIRYLNDCTHALKGQAVELPAWNP
jgi:hypothetical protein